MPYDVYIISELGGEFINKNNIYLLMHRYSGWEIDWIRVLIDTCKINKNREHNLFSIADSVWNLFNHKILEGNEYNYAKIYTNMGQFLLSDFHVSKKYEIALELFLQALYYEISGVCLKDYIGLVLKEHYTKEKVREDLKYKIFMPEILIDNNIAPYIKYLNDDIMKNVLNLTPSINMASKEFFIKLITSIKNGNYDKFKFKEELLDEYMLCFK